MKHTNRQKLKKTLYYSLILNYLMILILSFQIFLIILISTLDENIANITGKIYPLSLLSSVGVYSFFKLRLEIELFLKKTPLRTSELIYAIWISRLFTLVGLILNINTAYYIPNRISSLMISIAYIYVVTEVLAKVSTTFELFPLNVILSYYKELLDIMEFMAMITLLLYLGILATVYGKISKNYLLYLFGLVFFILITLFVVVKFASEEQLKNLHKKLKNFLQQLHK